MDLYYETYKGFQYLASCESWETAEAAINAAGWFWSDEAPQSFVNKDKVHLYDYEIYVGKRMHYGEYRRNYGSCRTLKGSYDPTTKTIVVMVQE